MIATVPVRPVTEVIPTMISLDYERDRWGNLRILLDTISNHIDAAGSSADIRVDVLQDRISVSDPGAGFDCTLLGLLHSTKKAGDPTIGQFGEGLKLVAAACLRAGLRFALRSRDWMAEAFAQTVHYTDADGQTRGVDRLAWRVTRGMPRVPGATSTIMPGTSPIPAELADMFSRWREYFLDDTARTRDMVWEDPRPRLFVRGVFVRELPDCAFSYNLVTRDISRDRDTLNLYDALRTVWKQVSDPAIAEAYFRRSAVAYARDPGKPPTDLSIYFRPEDGHRDTWKEGWHRAFGERAVISTSPEASYRATSFGYLPVSLLPAGCDVARSCGVDSDSTVLSQRECIGARPLTPEEEAVVRTAMAAIRLVNPSVSEWPVEAMDTPPDALMGLADMTSGTIFIRSSRLQDARSALRVLLEEVAHMESGGGDFTRTFEEWLVDFGAAAAALAMGLPRE